VSGVLAEATERARCDLETARLFYPRDSDLVVALHERLATELEARVVDLPVGSMAERFAATMRLRLRTMAPYRSALRTLMAALLDPEGEHGVLSSHTETVRARVEAVFVSVVLGASDRPDEASHARALARALYGVHLGLILLWTQDRTTEGSATDRVIELVQEIVTMAAPLMLMPMLGGLIDRIDAALSPWIAPSPDAAHTEDAKHVLRALFRHRRLLPGAEACAADPCEQCLALHLPKVRRFIAAGQPIHFVLPAFPAKSPSPKKVLGKLPDMAERLAIRYLQAACDEIAALYAPGARVTICSDGRVFGDLVAVSDDDITSYANEIDTLIAAMDAASVDTFCMDDLLGIEDFDAMRDHVVQHYAEPLDELEQRARDFPHHRAMWNGMQRFLFEDRVAFETDISRTQLRKKCGMLAHRVIRRSNAWTRVVAECFPTALRLSIHPQPPHSDKIGMRLAQHEDVWLTPWHGVAVERNGTFELMQRHQAEALGAEVVELHGQPSHLKVTR